MGNFLAASDISASGLAAERLRMEVIASNVANAHTTRTAEGGPYQRQQVVLAPSFGGLLQGTLASQSLSAVEVAAVEPDASPFPQVFDPGHPDADAQGFVTMPNIRIANEMVDMITATRAYEANLQALRNLRAMVQNSIALLRNS